MDGVLDQMTNTVHKHDSARSDLEAKCGATAQLKRERLRMARVPKAVAERDASMCETCFEGQNITSRDGSVGGLSAEPDPPKRR